MFKKFLLLVLALTLLMSKATLADVIIETKSTADKYRFNPRLDFVLQKYASDTSIYWPSAVLLRKYDQKTEALRAEVIAQLRSKISELEPSGSRRDLENLLEQVTGWELGKHLDLVLDYDLVRIKEEHNPVIDSGDYRLIIGSRPQSVIFFGMLESEQDVSHLNGADIREYLKSLSPVKLADNDYVYIIPPNGTVIKANIAYWSNEHIEAAPGSKVYIPLSEHLFSGNEALNFKIAELARNRLQ